MICLFIKIKNSTYLMIQCFTWKLKLLSACLCLILSLMVPLFSLSFIWLILISGLLSSLSFRGLVGTFPCQVAEASALLRGPTLLNSLIFSGGGGFFYSDSK